MERNGHAQASHLLVLLLLFLLPPGAGLLSAAHAWKEGRNEANREEHIFELERLLFAELLIRLGVWSGWGSCSETGFKNRTLLCQEEALPSDLQGIGFCDRVMQDTAVNITNTTRCLPGMLHT